MVAPIHGIELHNGVPHVYARSVTTAEVLEDFMRGHPIDAIARSKRLAPEDVERAIRFECCATCPCDECVWARELAGLSPIVERKK
jgi:hypothetical protein